MSYFLAVASSGKQGIRALLYEYEFQQETNTLVSRSQKKR